MEYIVIGICLIAIVAIGARIFFKPKSKATVTPTVSVSPKEDEELSLSAPQGESAHDLVIQVEMLPAEAISGEGSLVEITDSKVLARVNNLIPNLAQAGNAANNAVQAVDAKGEVLYRAIPGWSLWLQCLAHWLWLSCSKIPFTEKQKGCCASIGPT